MFSFGILVKTIRTRNIFNYLNFCLNKLTTNMQVQQLLNTLFNMILLMMLSACCWKLFSGFELGSNKSWLRNDGCFDSPPME